MLPPLSPFQKNEYHKKAEISQRKGQLQNVILTFATV